MGVHQCRAVLARVIFISVFGGALPSLTQDSGTPDLDLYGSWRLQANYVKVDESSQGEGNDFIGLTDAYSRLGAKLAFGAEAVKLTARYEVNINSADLDFGDPSFFDMRTLVFTASKP